MRSGEAGQRSRTAACTPNLFSAGARRAARSAPPVGLDAHRGCSSPLPEKNEPSPEEHRHRGSNRRAQRRRSAAPLDPTYHGTRRQRSGASAGERARGFRPTLLTPRLCICRASHARGGRRARAPGTSGRACSSSSKGSTAAPAPRPPPGLLGGRERGGQPPRSWLGGAACCSGRWGVLLGQGWSILLASPRPLRIPTDKTKSHPYTTHVRVSRT